MKRKHFFIKFICPVLFIAVLELPAAEQATLHTAAYRGDYYTALALIKKGENVNARDSQGKTPLFYTVYLTAYYGRMIKYSIVELFINNGADVNAYDNSGRTPLMEALHHGVKESALLLIKKGADIRRSDSAGLTALHEAAGKCDVETVKIIIERGGEINVPDSGGWTPLHESCENTNVENAAFLVNGGAAVNSKNEDGNTPLYLAVQSESPPIVEFLLAHGAEAGTVNIHGITPLHAASVLNSPKITELLLSAGAEINTADRSGWTPLHRAAYFGKYHTAGLLLKKGSDPFLKNSSGDTPGTLSARQGYQNITNLISEHTAKNIQKNGSAVITPEKIKKKIHDQKPVPRGRIFAISATSWLKIPNYPDKFSPERAFDDERTTAWVEGVPGDGIGEKLHFTVTAGITKIAIFPGYGFDLRHFRRNNRLKKARLTIRDIHPWKIPEKTNMPSQNGTKEMILEFRDEMELQEFQAGAAQPGSGDGYECTIEIVEVYKGTVWSDTCISEIKIFEQGNP